MKRTYTIVIEGPIGVGKTTLVRRLSERLPCRTVYESFEENPFLADFYQDRARYAFQTEMFFLLSRFRQHEHFAQSDLFQPITVSDYLFHKCRLFAGMTLTAHELALFDEVFRVLSRSVLPPDLVVYLHAPLEVLLERIARRGRAYEARMDPDYLAALCRIYEEFFATFAAAPLVSVDTTDLDFATSDAALGKMIAVLEERPTRRVYLSAKEQPLFSPTPS